MTTVSRSIAGFFFQLGFDALGAGVRGGDDLDDISWRVRWQTRRLQVPIQRHDTLQSTVICPGEIMVTLPRTLSSTTKFFLVRSLINLIKTWISTSLKSMETSCFPDCQVGRRRSGPMRYPQAWIAPLNSARMSSEPLIPLQITMIKKSIMSWVNNCVNGHLKTDEVRRRCLVWQFPIFG